MLIFSLMLCLSSAFVVNKRIYVWSKREQMRNYKAQITIVDYGILLPTCSW